MPEKAIVLEDVTVIAVTGESVDIRRPVVVRDRCIGCGICENRCPLNGEAANAADQGWIRLPPL